MVLLKKTYTFDEIDIFKLQRNLGFFLCTFFWQGTRTYKNDCILQGSQSLFLETVDCSGFMKSQVGPHGLVGPP